VSIKGIIRFLIFSLLLIVLMGCGRKAPPSLPEKPSSQREQRGREGTEFTLTSIATDLVEVFFDATDPKTK
jgi:predicted small lipoprotein YifL